MLNILGWLGGIGVGLLSAAIVVSLWRLVGRRTQVRLETVFGVCGVAGLAMWFVGQMIASPALAAASVALWGWVIVPIVALPVVLLWRLRAWCRQRLVR